jgi:hypothetical protein
MPQSPGPQPGWTPLSPSQFSTAAGSTALSIPNAATQSPPIRGYGDYVAILIPQGGIYWVRTDGQAAVAASTGGVALNAATSDYRYVYGLVAMRNIRFIQGAGGTQMVVEYYFFRSINV